ncbi:MAG: diphosphate--fructose-6-phosphate 1-phosphotransferase [candidate division KSB1 bacterium]|nr:diphosphate--fructose-6-phosphate 1-phosphotransferase [candidate division KSB1 bacterium]MDZ7318880.1 diphosphate--fructose-6-phosphate 1-phosphotransferase [candidate division KSB1 bacterium]MDZ7342491.1 diphosphate--fructose-6-phosphate 1-phosphotransferase [candidate division KSB1 bacterium]
MFNSVMGYRGTLGIVVGGGPAPGINGAISAATIEAQNAGLKVLGILDGFEWLQKEDTDHIIELEIKDVSRIHFTGGSILRTSRANPLKNETLMQNTLNAIKRLGLNYLITIGGDDTAYAALQIAKRLAGQLRVAHVPKTIDNDLPLPKNLPSIGYETARHVGVQLVQNIMEDSRSTNRWYIVVTMGLKSGHLTLGICKAAGATLAIIGEEFPREKISINDVCDVLEGAIIKRKAMGRQDGVVLIAEGIAGRFIEDELRKARGANLIYDDYGNMHLSEIELGKIIKAEMERRLTPRGDKIRMIEMNIGYTLRCAPPIPFDCEYVRDLGYAAVQFLVNPQYEHQNSAMICVEGGKLVPIQLDFLLDPMTEKIRVRQVDIQTDSYAVAQEYMIKLKKSDFEEPEQLLALAKAAKMTPELFRKRFEHLVRR